MKEFDQMNPDCKLHIESNQAWHQKVKSQRERERNKESGGRQLCYKCQDWCLSSTADDQMLNTENSPFIQGNKSRTSRVQFSLLGVPLLSLHSRPSQFSPCLRERNLITLSDLMSYLYPFYSTVVFLFLSSPLSFHTSLFCPLIETHTSLYHWELPPHSTFLLLILQDKLLPSVFNM